MDASENHRLNRITNRMFYVDWIMAFVVYIRDYLLAYRCTVVQMVLIFTHTSKKDNPVGASL